MEISYSCCLILNWPNLKLRNENFLQSEGKDEDFDIAYGVYKYNFGAFPLFSKLYFLFSPYLSLEDQANLIFQCKHQKKRVNASDKDYF